MTLVSDLWRVIQKTKPTKDQELKVKALAKSIKKAENALRNRKKGGPV